ncbi:hypothetical protein SAMN05421754_100725 [Nitrosomonas sp. Nm58]|nr:hypothetical protein SAMN05421754_100725 [Nitrosomonas sp. Nm58]
MLQGNSLEIPRLKGTFILFCDMEIIKWLLLVMNLGDY